MESEDEVESYEMLSPGHDKAIARLSPQELYDCLHWIKPVNIPTWTGKKLSRPLPLPEEVLILVSFWGKRESFCFEGMTSGRFPMLQWMVPHPRAQV